VSNIDRSQCVSHSGRMFCLASIATYCSRIAHFRPDPGLETLGRATLQIESKRECSIVGVWFSCRCRAAVINRRTAGSAPTLEDLPAGALGPPWPCQIYPSLPAASPLSILKLSSRWTGIRLGWSDRPSRRAGCYCFRPLRGGRLSSEKSIQRLVERRLHDDLILEARQYRQ